MAEIKKRRANPHGRRKDNHQETDRSAIVTKTNSGGGCRKPKLERKCNSKWNLGFVRKHVDSSAKSSISHCLPQRGTTPGTVSPPDTKKPERTISAELSQFAPSTPSPDSEMQPGRLYVSRAPQPASVS